MIDACDLETGPPAPMTEVEVVAIPAPPPLPTMVAPATHGGFRVTASGLETSTFTCERCGTWEERREMPCECLFKAFERLRTAGTRRVEARLETLDGRLLARRTSPGEKAEEEGDDDGADS